MSGSRREVVSWCLFDFANSAFTTVVVTTVFAVYFVKTVVPAAGTGLRGETLWSWCNSASLVVAALLSPVLGAVADARALKRALLVVSSLACIGATALLATVRAGDVARAMILFVIANVGFELGYVFYNGFLPEIAPPEQAGRISGFGWATGYIGGLVSLAVALIPLRLLLPASPSAEQAASAVRTCFLIVAAHFLLFALPAFFSLRDRPALPARAPAGAAPASGLLEPFRQVARTLRTARRHSEVFKFIVANLVYNDGLVTVFAFAGIFMSDVLRFSQAEVVLLVLVINVPSALGSFAFGFVSDRIGGKKTILLTLAILVAAVVAMAATAPAADAPDAAIHRARVWFWAISMLVGLGIGANQSASRGLMAQLVPEGRHGEFFGFFIFSGKLASVFAPLTYGLVVQLTGSSVLAILSVTIFLVGGGLLLLRVDEKDGPQAGPGSRLIPRPARFPHPPESRIFPFGATHIRGLNFIYSSPYLTLAPDDSPARKGTVWIRSTRPTWASGSRKSARRRASGSGSSPSFSGRPSPRCTSTSTE